MYDDITRKLRSLGEFGRHIIPSKLCGPDFEPTRSDAVDGINDLQLLARKVDDVIFQYGLYWRELGLISADDLRDHFTDTLSKAIDGNATFCLERGVEDRIAEREYA